MTMKRHIGKMKNTDKRIVVLMSQLQDEKGTIINAGKAMVVDTDSLPERLHQPLMTIVDSVEGQQETILARLLSRRFGPDHGTDMFSSLGGTVDEQGSRTANFISVVDVENVIMYPEPNHPIALTKILEATQNTKNGDTVSQVNEKYNVHNANSAVGDSEEAIAKANNLIRESDDLMSIANAKRDQAYKIAPQLKPRTGSHASVTAEAAVVDEPEKKTTTRKKKAA